jgi:hypothetical protein
MQSNKRLTRMRICQMKQANRTRYTLQAGLARGWWSAWFTAVSWFTVVRHLRSR